MWPKSQYERGVQHHQGSRGGPQEVWAGGCGGQPGEVPAQVQLEAPSKASAVVHC